MSLMVPSIEESPQPRMKALYNHSLLIPGMSAIPLRMSLPLIVPTPIIDIMKEVFILLMPAAMALEGKYTKGEEWPHCRMADVSNMTYTPGKRNTLKLKISLVEILRLSFTVDRLAHPLLVDMLVSYTVDVCLLWESDLSIIPFLPKVLEN